MLSGASVRSVSAQEQPIHRDNDSSPAATRNQALAVDKVVQHEIRESICKRKCMSQFLVLVKLVTGFELDNLLLNNELQPMALQICSAFSVIWI